MSAREFIPDGNSLGALREAAASCRGCHLHERATQTVFGEGPRKARIVLVGEMAGDREDREGRDRDETSRGREREALASDLRMVAGAVGEAR